MAQYALIYPLPNVPTTDPAYSNYAICPPVVECPRYPALNFVDTRADTWNCIGFCGADSDYYSLYKVGDVIPLQLNLPDVRNINNIGTRRPQIGWRQTDLINPFYYVSCDVFDLNDCTTPILELVDQFCTDWWCGYSDAFGSLQTLFVDTGQISVPEGFILRVTTWDDLLNQRIVVWSEPFMRIDKRASCEATVLIQSRYPSVDCENRDYRKPENDYSLTGAPLYAVKIPFIEGISLTHFYTSWRYEGEVLEQGNSSEQTFNDNDVLVQQKIIRQYNFETTAKLPPYAYDILTAQMRGVSVTIDNVEYTNVGDITKEIEGGKMFMPSVPLERVCNLNNLRC